MIAERLTMMKESAVVEEMTYFLASTRLRYWPRLSKVRLLLSVAGGVQAHQFRIEQLSRPLVTRILTTIITLLRSPRRT